MKMCWYTARELAEMRLTGLPKTESAIIRKAKRESWTGRKRLGTKAQEYMALSIKEGVAA
jgi:hypothetical protein